MAPSMIPPAAASGFLQRAGWGDAEILPLAGDASFRRYFRVIAPARRAVLMDAPPPHEDPRPFLAVAEHLIALGFAAPRTLAADLDHGLVLLEDFGDARMREVIDAAPEAEGRIYADGNASCFRASDDAPVRVAAGPARRDREHDGRRPGAGAPWRTAWDGRRGGRANGGSWSGRSTMGDAAGHGPPDVRHPAPGIARPSPHPTRDADGAGRAGYGACIRHFL